MTIKQERQDSEPQLKMKPCMNCGRIGHSICDHECPARGNAIRITTHLFWNKFSQPPLLPSVKLSYFDGIALASSTRGRITTRPQHGETCHEVELRILPPPCAPVIGQDVIRQSGLHIDGASLQVRAITLREVLRELPHQFTPYRKGVGLVVNMQRPRIAK